MGVQEIRIPVDVPTRIIGDGRIPELPPELEYYVLELWPDDTVRHPTTGRRVAREVYEQEPARCQHWLRTGQYP